MALFRRPDPDPDPVAEQQEAIRALARAFLEVGSDQPWDRREITIKPLLSGIQYRMVEHSGDRIGTAADLLPDQLSLEVVRLLRAMCTDKGTWLSMQLTVTRQGQADARFNYQDEPGEVAGPPGMPVAEVHAHLEAFPRPHDLIPGWMQARLAGQEPGGA